MSKKEQFVRVPRWIDDLCYALRPTESRVLRYIVRKTFGFNKGYKFERISLSQFKDGNKAVPGCGLTQPTISKCVAELEKKGIIEVEKTKRGNKYRVKGAKELINEAPKDIMPSDKESLHTLETNYKNKHIQDVPLLKTTTTTGNDEQQQNIKKNNEDKLSILNSINIPESLTSNAKAMEYLRSAFCKSDDRVCMENLSILQDIVTELAQNIYDEKIKVLPSFDKLILSRIEGQCATPSEISKNAEEFEQKRVDDVITCVNNFMDNPPTFARIMNAQTKDGECLTSLASFYALLANWVKTGDMMIDGFNRNNKTLFTYGFDTFLEIIEDKGLIGALEELCQKKGRKLQVFCAKFKDLANS